MRTTSGSAAGPVATSQADLFTVWPRRRSTAAALIGLITLQVCVLFAVTQRSFFIADDYYHFKLAQERSLLHYVATPIVHTYPAPGHRLLFFAFHQFFPMNYVAARVVLLAFLAAATVLLAQFVRMLARTDEWWTTALLTPFALSLAFVSVVDWWSAGVPVIPALFFTTAALVAWFRSYVHPKPSHWLAVAIVAMAAASGFYLKFLLIPFYFLVLRLAIFPRVLGLRGGVQPLWEERRRWLAVAAFPALFLAVYVLSGLAGRSYVPGERSYLAYLATGWFEVFVPLALLNTPVGPSTSVTATWIVVVCSQLVFWAVVWVTWRRTSLALYGWALVVFVFAVNLLMIGSVRLPAYGVAIAYPLRYYPEILLFLPVALALALRQGTERRPEAAWEGTGAGRTALAAFACVHAMSFVLQAPAMGRASEGVQARAWIDNLRRDATAAAEGGGVRLLDSEVPEYVIPLWLTPLNRVSTLLGLLQVDAVYNEFSDSPRVVRSDGRLAEATFRPLSRLLLSPHRTDTGADGQGRTHVDGACIQGAETVLMSRAPGDEPIGERLALRLSYSAGSRGPLALEVESVDPDVTRTWSLHPERGAEIVDLGWSRPTTLNLRGNASSVVCLDRIDLGSLITGQALAAPPSSHVDNHAAGP